MTFLRNDRMEKNQAVPFEAGLAVAEEHGVLGQTLPDLLGLGGAQPQLAVFQQEPGQHKQTGEKRSPLDTNKLKARKQNMTT